jgi:hypothetical protein
MRSPRFTVRRLMVVVAASATAFAVPGWTDHRRAEFLRVAAWHDEESFIASAFWGGCPGFARRKPYHQYMARKYRDAALHPWLPVEPDPPEPEDALMKLPKLTTRRIMVLVALAAVAFGVVAWMHRRAERFRAAPRSFSRRGPCITGRWPRPRSTPGTGLACRPPGEFSKSWASMSSGSRTIGRSFAIVRMPRSLRQSPVICRSPWISRARIAKPGKVSVRSSRDGWASAGRGLDPRPIAPGAQQSDARRR